MTVLGNTGNLVRAGYRFIGWTLTPDGSGTVYQGGDTFLMPENNVVLYALWEAVPPVPYTVVYDGNGAESGTIPAGPEAYEAGDTVIVLGNTGNLSASGYVFAGWVHGPGRFRACIPGRGYVPDACNRCNPLCRVGAL